MKVINFGSCNIDYVYSMPHFVKPGETLGADALNIFPGGKGLNQSLAIARSGQAVYHAGAIGKDGLFLKEILEEASADTSYLAVMDAPSGHAIIQVDSKGENCIILHGGTNFMIDEAFADKVLADFSAGDIIVLQNEISCLHYIIDRAYEKGMKVVLNPSPFDETLARLDLGKIAILMLNKIEAAEFSGTEEPDGICEYFRSNYPELQVVLTLGSKGCLYFDKNEKIFCPSFEVEVKDTTSAGDTFTGYFVSGLVSGFEIPKCLKTATAAAALAVSKNGAAVSIPKMAEVEEALKDLKPKA